MLGTERCRTVLLMCFRKEHTVPLNGINQITLRKKNLLSRRACSNLSLLVPAGCRSFIHLLDGWNDGWVDRSLMNFMGGFPQVIPDCGSSSTEQNAESGSWVSVMSY